GPGWAAPSGSPADLVCVPVVRLKAIGRQTMKVADGVPQVVVAGAFGGGQSWLVGYAPLSALVSGVHASVLRVPPLQVPLPHTPGVPPVQVAHTATGASEPVRKILESRGKFRLFVAPVLQVAVPVPAPAAVPMTLCTQVPV